MIDYGLLISVILAFGIPAVLSTRWRIAGSGEPVSFLDAALGPAFVGLAVGRVTTLVLDDPNSIGSVSDMLIVRSGVEFWPGVAAALTAAAVSARMASVAVGRRIVDLVPLAMVGYAGFEATCAFRDGCFGPASQLGLRPPGISITMLPIGWLMAVAIAAAAVGVRALVVRGHSSALVVAVATTSVASVRAIGSIWLPHVGGGLTRQHTTSVVIAAAAAVATLVATVVERRSQTTYAGTSRLSQEP